MNHLKLSLLTFSLATLMLGCSQDSGGDPLVPEISGIEIDGAENNSTIHAIYIDTDIQKLVATVIYSDGTTAPADSQLEWESNDTSVIQVVNGIIVPVGNGGTAAISASFRNKIHTTHDKNITVDPLTDINISTDNQLLTINYEANASIASADVNNSGPYTFFINGTFKDGNTTEKISSNVSWSSSNTSVATITATGDLTIYDTNNSVEINASVFGDINATLDLNISY